MKKQSKLTAMEVDSEPEDEGVDEVEIIMLKLFPVG